MKKILLIIAIAGFALTARSQSSEYKAFKFDIGLGYAIPSKGGNATKGGVSFTLQPHYRLSDAFAVGLRLEGAALAYVKSSSTSEDDEISVLGSYCATGEYYLSNSGFRPFIGAGAGLFTQEALTINTAGETYGVPGVNKFGFFPEIGFETGHFRMSADLNVVGSDSGYLGFKIGFFFGGGKK